MTSIDALPTPALLLDLDILEANIDRMQSLADRHHVRLRPHAKTHKCVEIARLQHKKGARGLTVATYQELEAFARAGFKDLTWAIPNTLSRLNDVFALSEDITVRLLTDDLDAAKTIARVAAAKKRRPHVLIKIDCGYHRAGIDPRSDEAIALVEYLAGEKAIVFDGILTHSGHAYHAQTKDELAAIAKEECEVMVNFASRAREQGLPVQEISIGSTPALSVTKDLHGVTEIRPGNYVFYDYTQVALGACRVEDCALTVLASVISHQKNNAHFVTDAGALSLSKDPGPDPERVAFIFEDYAAKKNWCTTSRSTASRKSTAS